MLFCRHRMICVIIWLVWLRTMRQRLLRERFGCFCYFYSFHSHWPLASRLQSLHSVSISLIRTPIKASTKPEVPSIKYIPKYQDYLTYIFFKLDKGIFTCLGVLNPANLWPALADSVINVGRSLGPYLTGSPQRRRFNMNWFGFVAGGLYCHLHTVPTTIKVMRSEILVIHIGISFSQLLIDEDIRWLPLIVLNEYIYIK